MREMFASHASFDATEWTFMDFGYFYDFWPFLGVKNGGFGGGVLKASFYEFRLFLT